ncbi:MAG: hypothetical protein HZA53_15805 [Planctomycetes bacterium]|nr:hypothetical protein [Planctomycetota bacterium]
MSLFTPSAWIARLLRIAGIVLLVIGVCPSYVVQGDPARRSERWTVGVDSSPLFRHERTSSDGLDGEGKCVVHSSSYDFDFLSWSMAAFVGAVVLLASSRALRRKALERAVQSS